MSMERIFKLLKSIGLSPTESKVYIYLAKVGPSRAKDISIGLRMTKQQLYPALKSLRMKEIVNSRPERAALFSTFSFEEILDLFVKSNIDQTKAIIDARQEIINSWRDLNK